MVHHWQLQEAKARLSELVKLAANEPQFISVHGHPAVVVISQCQFDTLTAPSQPIVDFFQQSPLRGVDLDFERDQSQNRDIAL